MLAAGMPDESIVGQTIKVKFLDVVEDEGKLVVSQKRATTPFELVRGNLIIFSTISMII